MDCLVIILLLWASSAWASYDTQPTPIFTATPQPTATLVPTATPQPTFAYTPPTPVPTATPQTLPTVKFFWISNTANNNVSAVGTQYMTVSGNQSANNTEAVVDNAAPQAFTVKNLHCQTHNIQPGSGKSYTLTFRSGSPPADTALTCTIADTAIDCSDNVHTVSVAQDDFFTYSVTPTNSPAGTPMHCGVEVNP